jgi:RNA polymerase sigma factor for flagellar operon FliA
MLKTDAAQSTVEQPVWPRRDTVKLVRPSEHRDELIRRGIVLVRRLAFRLARRLPPHVDVDDLISAGTEALLRVLDTYDPSSGVPVEAYLSPRLRGAIIDEQRAHDTLTRHARKQLASIARAVKDLEATLRRAPDEAEIAAALGIELEAYHKLTENLSRGPALQCLDSIDPDEVGSGDPASLVEADDLRRRLARAIERLPERTRTELGLYYQEECTLAEIGQILGVSESRVCQLLGDANVRLRALLAPEDKPHG